MDGEKTKSSKLDDEEKDERTEDKNTETKDRENVDHSDENDKKIKDDNDDDDDNIDDNVDNVDKEDGDHDDTNSGSGDLPAKQADNTPNKASTTTASKGSLDKDTANHIDKTTAKENDEHNEKEDKMEDAINNENEADEDEEDDEDEDKENASRIEVKEQNELEPGMTTETRQKFQQSTVHKSPNKNASHVQDSSESPPKPTQEQIHQLSTIHKVKNVQKLDNERQKTRKIYVQHASMHSTVHTEKNVASSEALMKKQKKPNKQVKIAKATHHKHNVNLKHHEVKHNDKNHKKPRKSKTLLKYIHRPNLHKKRVGTKLHKTPQHKCNSDNVKHGYSLQGGTRAGHVQDLGGSAGMHECIKRCCHKKVCDVALMLDGRCFGIACYSKELCKPVMVPHPHYVNSQIAFLDRAQRRDEVEGARPEFDCKYGELTIRNNHRWSGELCGGVVTCRNGVVTIEKCPAVPPKPTDCANPILEVQHRPGQCCIKKWTCKDKSCEFGGRRIPHGVSLSDQLCTGVVKCMNGHLEMKECPALPKKPTNCAHPKLKITTVPGQCCKKRWICPDKSCSYGDLKIEDGERLTDASCAVVMECKNGFLDFKQCPDPPPIPSACLNPTLKVKRILGECCHRKWACAQETK